MPMIAQIAHIPNIATPADLAAELSELVDAGLITRTQLVTVLGQLRHRLPADVNVSQRTRKGVLYVTARTPIGALSFMVSPRAKVLAVKAADQEPDD